MFDIGNLVTTEKRVGLKNLHVVDAPPSPYWFDLRIYARARDVLRLLDGPSGWRIGLLLPPAVARRAVTTGLKRAKPTATQLSALERFLGRKPRAAELAGFFTVSDLRRGASIEGFPSATKGFPLLLVCQPGQGARRGSLTIVQQRGKRVLGGNTFVLRRARR